MRLHLFGFLVIGLLLLSVNAEPEPKPNSNAKREPRGRFGSFRAANAAEAKSDNANNEKVDDKEVKPMKSDSSIGRFFMKKLFGNQQSQPIVIVTGGTGSGTGTASPTTTVTSTGTIPTASGTITTSPTTGRTTGTTGGTAGTTAREIYGDDEQAEENSNDNNDTVNEQALQAALAAGAQEYVVTDEEIKGTGDSSPKASKRPNRVNLKRKNGRKGQVISVRIPPKYRRYFKNGQKVLLNTKNQNRPKRRRVVKKRGNRRRVNKKNKRRIVAG